MDEKGNDATRQALHQPLEDDRFTMNDTCTYLIRIEGNVNEAEINAMTPVQMTVRHSDPVSTLVAVGADQSGLVGLIRHLHGLGFVLLSVECTCPSVETKGE